MRIAACPAGHVYRPSGGCFLWVDSRRRRDAQAEPRMAEFARRARRCVETRIGLTRGSSTGGRMHLH